MAPSRSTRKAAPTAQRRTAKAAPVEQRRRTATATKPAPVKDVTKWATQAPTDYHRKFAQWIVREVGFDPDGAKSKRAAFLAGVSIGTAARNAFMGSDFLAEWRASEGLAKPGRRPAETPAPTSKRRKPAPVEEFDEEDSDDEEFDDDEEDSDEEGDDEFADDDEECDEEDSDDFDDDDETEEEPEPEPTPAKRRAGRPASKPATTRKAAPAARKASVPPRGKPRSTTPKADDDNYVF